MSIIYLKGDATNPKIAGQKIICHVCNDIGKWGRGFVLALSSRWNEPEDSYRRWHRTNNNFKLGEIQSVLITEDLQVVNMIAQRNIRTINKVPPIRYQALESCLIKLNNLAEDSNASIHMPRIGCGLAGGLWYQVEEIILKNLKVPVYVYDLP